MASKLSASAVAFCVCSVIYIKTSHHSIVTDLLYHPFHLHTCDMQENNIMYCFHKVPRHVEMLPIKEEQGESLKNGFFIL